jgi:hypothetical protein
MLKKKKKKNSLICFKLCIVHLLFLVLFSQDRCSFLQVWGYATRHIWSDSGFSFPRFCISVYTLGTMCDLSLGVREKLFDTLSCYS